MRIRFRFRFNVNKNGVSRLYECLTSPILALYIRPCGSVVYLSIGMHVETFWR